MSNEEVSKMVERIIEEARLSMATLAEEAGVTTASLYAWANGKRNPTPENLARLADALERRGGELTVLAQGLRQAVEEG